MHTEGLTDGHAVAWRTLAVLLGVIALAFVTACGGGDEVSSNSGSASESAAPPGDGKEITFVTPLIGHPVWLEAKRGFDEAAQDLGFDAKWVGPADIDVAQMVAGIERAATQQVDGIITMALNPSAMGPSIQKAKASDIPIVLVNSDGPDTGRDAYLGSSNEAMGQAAADGLGEALDGEGTVGILTGALDAENLNGQIKAFEERLQAEYPGIKIVTKEADNSDLAQATEKAEAMLRKYPDLHGVYNVEANGALAFCELLKQNPRDGFAVIGTDDLDQTLDCIRSGEVYGTIPQNFYGMGYYGAEALLALMEGREVPDTVDLGTTLITTENIETYKDDLAENGEQAAAEFAP